MNRLVFFLAVLCFVAGTAFGQAGYIGLFADTQGNDCDIVDTPMTVVDVYVVHMATPGATASAFKIIASSGFNMTCVAESTCDPVCGSVWTGRTASYGGCVASPILLVTVTFFAEGTSATCSYLEVVDHPTSGTIEVVDCSYQHHVAGGGRLYVNPDGSCPCGLVPANETSWGNIKTLYAD